MNRLSKILFSSTFFLFVKLSIFAQGGPPMLTDDPVTVEKGHWEINSGIILQHDAEEDEFEIPLEDVNFGLSNSVQLKYEIPLIIKHVHGSSAIGGLGKSNFGVKWRFFNNEKNKISISVYPQFQFNNNSTASARGITEEGTEFLLPFSFLKEFKGSCIVIQLGRKFESTNQGGWIFGLLYKKTVSKRVELAGEIFGNSGYNLKNNEIFLNAGARVKLTKQFTLLFSVGNNFINHNSTENKFISYLGLQLNL